ncbi:MAG: hypothetical protein JST00_05090 [Deltaproteobacteria bacterium]|nr:hypothetical protein [Deltaproteobacteria bacterium]
MSVGKPGSDLFAEPLEVTAAARLLRDEAELEVDDDARAIAELVGREAPALRWAASLARARGWRSLREKLSTWRAFGALVRSGSLPWHADVASALAALPPEPRALVTKLAACDAPATWELLEAALGEDALSVEMVCELEDAGVVRRTTRAGVVMFVVPFCVRAALRRAEASELGEASRGWIPAWRARARELRSSLYGSSARSTLVELACAIPLVERALLDDEAGADAVATWAAISDAMFFEGSVDYGSPAFARAVALADVHGDEETKVRARLAAARALLERGDPEGAEVLLAEARRLGERHVTLASEAQRGSGWAALASARLDDAKACFTRALAAAEGASDVRSRADAIAGLGMVALLSGDVDRAREHLTEALAIHVVARDAPREAAVKGMMILLPEARASAADEASLAAQAVELRASGQRWREALALGRLALVARERGDDAAARARLAEARAAAALSTVSAAELALAIAMEPASGASASSSAIVVGPEARWLELTDGTRHELGRHGPVRRILHALAVAHCERTGSAMTTLDLVAAGWPGEKMRHEAATLRVYTTVRRLRGLGLGDVLVTRDDGYLLDPDAPIALAPA